MRSARNVVVVGHGMVGHRFVDALRSRDPDGAWRVTILAEEADAAYDRVGLTGYTEHWDRGLLALPGNDYSGDDLVELRLGSPVAEIDRAAKAVVIGGGLLGLEAANALRQFGLQTHVVEMAPRLMAQQLDEAGGALLGRMMSELGIVVHVGVGTQAIEPAQRNRPVRRSAEDNSV